jgi:CRP/FNR family cyclic AMP-dependent transcriptional regulator
MKKILLIEDNLEVCENLEEILSLSNYKVFTAENGVVGVETALKVAPDLIICDVMMPKLDGFGVLRILGQKPQTSDIPFIFLTAKTDKSDFRMGMNLGADDYITKPFHHMELLDAITIRLKKAERMKKAFMQNPMENKKLLSESRGQRELEKLAEAKETTFYHKKDILFSEGEVPKRLFYVVKGKVKTFRSNENGKEFITGVFKKGEFLGFQALLKDAPYSEFAAAMEDAEVSFIPKENFMALLQGSRDFSARFVKMLVNNVVDKEEQLLHLAYNSIRKRVADALLKLNNKYREEGEVKLDILRDDLAGMVGTAKESVSRMLTDFKTERLIEIDNHGVITIMDEHKLADIPN